MFVATLGERILGTASLDGRVVRTVFVEPGYQGKGIGRRLMAEVEREALARGVALLAVPSSVTAEPFYSKLGFRAVRDAYHGEERTIVMERDLAGASTVGMAGSTHASPARPMTLDKGSLCGAASPSPVPKSH